MRPTNLPYGFVNADGGPWSPSSADVVAKPRPARGGDKLAKHKGWIVSAHLAADMERAQSAAAKAMLEWEKDKAGRPPAIFSRDFWLANTNKKRLRKPFEIESAAHEFAAMARKDQRFIDVTVTSLES